MWQLVTVKNWNQTFYLFFVSESVMKRILEHRQIVEQSQNTSSFRQLWSKCWQRFFNVVDIFCRQNRGQNNVDPIRRSNEKRSVAKKSNYLVTSVVFRQPFDQSVGQTEFRHFMFDNNFFLSFNFSNSGEFLLQLSLKRVNKWDKNDS